MYAFIYVRNVIAKTIEHAVCRRGERLYGCTKYRNPGILCYCLGVFTNSPIKVVKTGSDSFFIIKDLFLNLTESVINRVFFFDDKLILGKPTSKFITSKRNIFSVKVSLNSTNPFVKVIKSPGGDLFNLINMLLQSGVTTVNVFVNFTKVNSSCAEFFNLGVCCCGEFCSYTRKERDSIVNGSNILLKLSYPFVKTDNHSADSPNGFIKKNVSLVKIASVLDVMGFIVARITALFTHIKTGCTDDVGCYCADIPCIVIAR